MTEYEHPDNHWHERLKKKGGKAVNKAFIRCAITALLVGPLVAPLACASKSLTIAEGKYAFTSFDYPGAALTQAYGNNPRGDIVGTYQLPTGRESTVLPKGVQKVQLDAIGLQPCELLAVLQRHVEILALFVGFLAHGRTLRFDVKI